MSAIYVATKWNRREEARLVMDRLVAAGHAITHDWTHEDDMSGASGPQRDVHFMACAQADVVGVTLADCLILLHDPAARGAFVELGVALACNVPVIVVGGLEAGSDPALNCPIFYWMPGVRHASTVDEALALLAPG